MKLAMVGLGRMGANMARRLIRGGHTVVAFNRDQSVARAFAETEGATAADSYESLAAALEKPRIVWLMVPDNVVDSAIAAVAPHLAPGDVIIDGGNSNFREDVRRAKELSQRGIEYVDVGTSGGVWGLERGYCLMIGGKESVVQRLEPVFKTLAPGFESAPRSEGATGALRQSENGYLYCGGNGAGHYVKMVHNAIEYGMMAAFAEGFNLMRQSNYNFNLGEIAEVWRRGSVVGSWLLDLTARALAEDPELKGFQGRVGDSGEGRWTAQTALDAAVPMPVLAAALFGRFSSRGQEEYANKLLSAMRNQFGGHKEPSQ